MFKLVGDRDALDELEEFIRIKMGTDCKARDIPETFRLIEIAFQDQVLNAPMTEEEEEEENVLETQRARLQGSGSKPRSVRSVASSSSATTTPALSPLSKDNGRFCDDNKSVKSTRSSKSIQSIKEEDEAEVSSIMEEDEDEEFGSAHPACEGYLATVLEEDEEEDSSPSSRRPTLSKKNSLASSTATFRPKSKKALQEMLLAQELANSNSSRSTLPQMDLSSFDNLSADGSLADFLSSAKSTSDYTTADEGEQEDEEEMAAPTVADLTKFWAKTTNALVRSNSQSTIRSFYSFASSTLTNIHAVTSSSGPSTSSATTPSLSSMDSTEKLPSSSTTITAHQSEIIESSISTYNPPTGPPSELEARVHALKSTASHSAIVAQLAEENAAQANVKDLVQATRYLPKYKIQLSAGFVESGNEEMVLEEDENEVGGVDVEGHMPVKDLKKRWEEIHRLGI